MLYDNLSGVSSRDDVAQSSQTNQLRDDKYVVFLAVGDIKEAAEISEKLSSFRLELGDYKKIRVVTTEEKSKWDSLLRRIKLDSRHPKTPEKILPYPYSELLRIEGRNIDTCPKFYELITRCNGNIVIAKCTKQLQKELRDNGVRFL